MRQIPHNKSLFVSPANGTVVAVRRFDSSEGDIFENKYENEDKIAGAIKLFSGDVDTKGTIISIHMNLDNVHIQRCPLSAKLIKLEYTKGDFKNAITKDSLLPYPTRKQIGDTYRTLNFIGNNIMDRQQSIEDLGKFKFKTLGL